jgi:hypothetical protein
MQSNNNIGLFVLTQDDLSKIDPNGDPIESYKKAVDCFERTSTGIRERLSKYDKRVCSDE